MDATNLTSGTPCARRASLLLRLASCLLAVGGGVLVTAACSSHAPLDGGPDGGASSDPVTGTDAGADSGADCVGAIDPASLDNVEVEQGRAAVMAFKCYACHQSTAVDAGLTLSGNDTSLRDGGAVYAPNLTPDPKTGLGCWTREQIANAVLDAIDDQGNSLCVMPKFRTKGMDAGAAQAVATFLKALPRVAHQVPDTTCPPAPADAGVPDDGQAPPPDDGQAPPPDDGQAPPPDDAGLPVPPDDADLPPNGGGGTSG